MSPLGLFIIATVTANLPFIQFHTDIKQAFVFTFQNNSMSQIFLLYVLLTDDVLFPDRTAVFIRTARVIVCYEPSGGTVRAAPSLSSLLHEKLRRLQVRPQR